MEEDSNDIIRRNVNTDNEADVAAEINCLYNRKCIGLKANFTRCLNLLQRIMVSAMYDRTNPEEEGPFDTTRITRDQLESSYQKIILAYEKLSLLHEKVLELNLNPGNGPKYQEEAGRINNSFNNVETNYGSLKYKIFSQKSMQAPQPETTNAAVKPMQALEPAVLSFDNNPIEMQAWMIQYKCYYKASKFDKLDNEEQLAFVRKSLHIEIWQDIFQSMTAETKVFHEDIQTNQEMSVFQLIGETFEV